VEPVAHKKTSVSPPQLSCFLSTQGGTPGDFARTSHSQDRSLPVRRSPTCPNARSRPRMRDGGLGCLLHGEIPGMVASSCMHLTLSTCYLTRALSYRIGNGSLPESARRATSLIEVALRAGPSTLFRLCCDMMQKAPCSHFSWRRETNSSSAYLLRPRSSLGYADSPRTAVLTAIRARATWTGRRRSDVQQQGAFEPAGTGSRARSNATFVRRILYSVTGARRGRSRRLRRAARRLVHSRVRRSFAAGGLGVRAVSLMKRSSYVVRVPCA